MWTDITRGHQPAFVKVLGEKIGKLCLAGPFMGHGQQLDHLAASVTLGRHGRAACGAAAR